MEASNVKFVHRPTLVGALMMARGGVGLVAVKIDTDEVGVVGLREHVPGVPVQNDLRRPPNTVIVPPTSV